MTLICLGCRRPHRLDGPGEVRCACGLPVTWRAKRVTRFTYLEVD